MKTKELKQELKVVQCQLNYYKKDKSRNGDLWDEKFKEFVDGRIEKLEVKRIELLKLLGYA